MLPIFWYGNIFNNNEMWFNIFKLSFYQYVFTFLQAQLCDLLVLLNSNNYMDYTLEYKISKQPNGALFLGTFR